jgi:hypothetical protein
MKAFPAVAPPLVQLKHRFLLEKIPGMAAAVLLLLLTLGTAWPSVAQEMPRVQVFGGYSYTRYDTPSFGFSSPTGLNGYTFSPAYNLIRGFGVVAELSGGYTTNRNLRDVAVGPQFLYARGKMMFSAHLLFGEARSLVQVGGPQEDSSRVPPWAEAWTTAFLPALRCAHFRWITCAPLCLTRRRTIFGFRLAWSIAGARSRRRTGRSRQIRSGLSRTDQDRYRYR